MGVACVLVGVACVVIGVVTVTWISSIVQLEQYSTNLEGIVAERTAELAAEKQKTEDLVCREYPPTLTMLVFSLPFKLLSSFSPKACCLRLL